VSESVPWALRDKVGFWSVLVLYPAALPLFTKNRRKVYYKQMKKKFISLTEQVDFWKEIEDQMKNPIEIKFTASDDYSLAYIDFIDLRKEKGQYEGPELPLTLLLSGAGTFSIPLYINKHDPLVKSLNYLCKDHKVRSPDNAILDLGEILCQPEQCASASPLSELQLASEEKSDPSHGIHKQIQQWLLRASVWV